ncbi:hypothetical protein EDD15DRAFT_2514842 [Pisolithus albus]|nr:hypothetical protein EDD15DRAFT_2514842 [Pisolithus albus]
MPTDVMAEIFEHCVHDSESQWYRPFNAKRAPLSLSQVCQSWRKLALALPRLWKVVRVKFPASSPDWYRLMQSQTTAMQLWISRSQSVPVSLFLTLYDHVIPSPSLALLDLEIMRAGPRIRELSLEFPSPSLYRLLSFMQGPLEFLEYLHLQSTDTFPTDDSIPPLVLPSAPSLKSLSISSYDIDMRGHQLPWAQLTELNLEFRYNPVVRPCNSDYLPILIQCPNLRTCSLEFGNIIEDIISDSVTSVTLPHLSILNVFVYVKSPYLELFFGALRLPKLRSVTIKYLGLFPLSAYFDETDCLGMLNRAAETVESVHFRNLELPNAELSSCLSQLSHLKTLQFYPGPLDRIHDLAAMLTVRIPSSATGHDDRILHQHIICPSLESLHLCSYDHVPVDAIVALVDSRRQSKHQLKALSLKHSLSIYERDRADELIRTLESRLSSYVDEGLQLTIGP